jgi:UDP-N-acetylglucosamine 2-epimerase (non-hydrolysing)
MKVILVAGARPNFMKIAPILEEMRRFPDQFQPVFVHTGQHYDDEMSRVFLEDLELPEPDVYLGVGSASHAVQTARIMMEFEKVMVREDPDLVMVVGDVNSTVACALVASKMYVPVAHVEAGLRSFDRTMPEEINRILTDQISNYLFTTCEEANANLRREGISEEKIHFVGNVMIHSLMKYREKAKKSDILERLGVNEKEYCLLTLHRPSNVDEEETFREILKALNQIQRRIKIVFPAHPRTSKMVEKLGLREQIANIKNLLLLNPIGYLHFLRLQEDAKFVITDSGGIQEESTFLSVPCLTIRENTERPITITQGTNTLVGTDPIRIVEESLKIISGNGKNGKIPKFWDDKVAQRIIGVLQSQIPGKQP